MTSHLGADLTAARRTAPSAPTGTVLFAAGVGPAVTVLRWGSVAYGLVALASERATYGWTAVLLLATCVFLTTLRTIMPLELGAKDRLGSMTPLVDVAVFAVVVGWSGATESPWLLCMLTAVGLAAYGWGRRHALVAGITAVVAVVAVMQVSSGPFSERFDDTADLFATVSLALAAAGGLFLRARAVEAARLAQRTSGELARLGAANSLLEQLTEVALTLPGAFTLREVLERTRQLLRTHVDPQAIVLLTLDEASGDWTPKMTDRASMRPAYHRDDLPPGLLSALQSGSTVVVRNRRSAGATHGGSAEGADPAEPADPASFISESAGVGIYMVLRTRNQVIGLLGLEHPDPTHFDHLDPVLRDGLGDVIALTVDNARWFARLRNLGAEEERLRVARDVHDRLGQWMTYLKLELERLAGSDTVDRSELQRLHDDAAFALDELRETLRQLRSGVSDDRPLSAMGGDLVERFADRSDVAARFIVHNPDQRLPVAIENEVLRILQEALNNVDRHAKAEHVEVEWFVDGGNYELVVSDDGRGFDPDSAIREQSYGLVGVRERADVIGASLDINSRPGVGTRLSIRAGVPTRPGGRTGATGPPAPDRLEIPT